MLTIVGHSACGKSTIEKELVDKHQFKKVVSYTTRPSRPGEIDGKDYHFVTSEIFYELYNDQFFAESAIYNGWMYGTAKEDCTDDKVAVVTPHGMRQLKKMKDLHIISFYIKVPRAHRLAQAALTREDTDEVIRRNISDCGQYDGLEDEVDHVIYNNGYRKSVQYIVGEILRYLV